MKAHYFQRYNSQENVHTANVVLRIYHWGTRIFIGIGCIGAALLFWFANGQPGIPVADGDYSCEPPSAHPLAMKVGAGATISGGAVVDVWYYVWDFSMMSGEKSSVQWSGFERKSASSFYITSVNRITGEQERFLCE